MLRGKSTVEYVVVSDLTKPVYEPFPIVEHYERVAYNGV